MDIFSLISRPKNGRLSGALEILTFSGVQNLEFYMKGGIIFFGRPRPGLFYDSGYLFDGKENSFKRLDLSEISVEKVVIYRKLWPLSAFRNLFWLQRPVSLS